jgi:hypothetical protein
VLVSSGDVTASIPVPDQLGPALLESNQRVALCAVAVELSEEIFCTSGTSRESSPVCLRNSWKDITGCSLRICSPSVAS